MSLERILDSAIAGEITKEADLRRLFSVELYSKKYYEILAAAKEKSVAASKGYAEIHGQIGLNISACPMDCKFCSFARYNKIFSENIETSFEVIRNHAKTMIGDGANAIYLMATADYSFDTFLDISKSLRKEIGSDVAFIANFRDVDVEEALQLKEVGFDGIYHAVRLGEGRDTKISVSKRIQTFDAAKKAGLLVGTCLEPVGPEHTIDELVEKTMLMKKADPVYGGAARRILIPHPELSRKGMISEAEMALYVAVTRLALSKDTSGTCTHEPNMIAPIAGANLFWAEFGSNPRDTIEQTEEKRGSSVQRCKTLFKETDWEVLVGSSRMFRSS